jgi:tetratricopeptide (TPR) repeat protein
MSSPPPGDAASSLQPPDVFERRVPLSRSLIWRRQREYYIQRGLETWTADNVPQFITNNPFIAEVYARIVFGFICDCREMKPTGARPESSGLPIQVLEVGAGTGKFAYLFLRHLEPLLRDNGIPTEAVSYTMTDCSESIIQSWRGSNHLAGFVQRGILGFRLFDACSEVGTPRIAGGEPGAGPLVVIANYVFDSLPQDAFVVEKGELFESLLAEVTRPEQEAVANLGLSFQNAGVSAERYPDPRWNQILDQYSKLTDASLLFPSAALKLLEQLRLLSDGRMLVLAADKGYTRAAALTLAKGPPVIESHTPECFSLMVNFDAIARYFQLTGGTALLPDKNSSTLHICGFLTGRPGELFARTRAGYLDAQAAFGPDDLFTLLAWLNAHMEEMNVAQILAALRLTRWDPMALLRLFPVLGRQLRTAVAEREDLRSAVYKTWANHFPLSPSENVLAFDCGVILLELRFFEEAMAMFRASQQVLGPSPSTSYNLGLCAMGLGRSAESLALMREACSLDPNFEPARSARVRLEAETQTRL